MSGSTPFRERQAEEGRPGNEWSEKRGAGSVKAGGTNPPRKVAAMEGFIIPIKGKVGAPATTPDASMIDAAAGSITPGPAGPDAPPKEPRALDAPKEPICDGVVSQDAGTLNPTEGSDHSTPEAVHSYVSHGIAIVPQLQGAKHPCVRWKAFQNRLPTPEELEEWFQERWPHAGMAAILGPVSNLLAIDVDGPEAHQALVQHLGGEPVAPKVLSGSHQPFRYHLFFRHPEGVPTRAKITPWHPKLEFRGRGGVIILPPSLHQSGYRYEWAPGRSLHDLPLAELPLPVLEALRERAVADVRGGAAPEPDHPVSEAVLQAARAYLAKLPPSTEGQGGDQQLYTAACHLVLDFHLPPEQALPLLQEYNQRSVPPWTEVDLRHKLEEANKKGESAAGYSGTAQCRRSPAQGLAPGRRHRRQKGNTFMAVSPTSFRPIGLSRSQSGSLGGTRGNEAGGR